MLQWPSGYGLYGVRLLHMRLPVGIYWRWLDSFVTGNSQRTLHICYHMVFRTTFNNQGLQCIFKNCLSGFELQTLLAQVQLLWKFKLFLKWESNRHPSRLQCDTITTWPFAHTNYCITILNNTNCQHDNNCTRRLHLY